MRNRQGEDRMSFELPMLVASCEAEASGTSENRAEELSPSSRDAINFPIRLLQLANRCQPEADIPSFSELARMVAQIKEPYADQM
jgi:hypothetical protein